MAHDINFNEVTGKYSFFSVKQTPWHGLGQIVDQYPTSGEAIKHAGLDYEVIKEPVFAKGRILEVDNTGALISGDIQIPDQFATIRTDTNVAFGVVGKDYQIIQNRDAFSFFDAIVGGGDGILYETAGALGNGERVFITAKLPGYIRVGNGDDVTEKYIFLSNAHDGTGSIIAAFTPIRVVCRNTLNAALKSMTNVVRIRHTANAKQRLEDAHKVMGIADRLTVEMEGLFNRWATVRITDAEVKKLIQLALCPNKETFDLLKKGAEAELSTVFKNTCESAFSYAMMSDTQQMETTKGTVFGAYNCITGYYQNVRKFKTDEDKFNSILLGGTAQQKAQKAFDLCAAFEMGGADSFKLN
jgi:phage/plasmid-like protein (TIGR03299 family)